MRYFLYDSGYKKGLYKAPPTGEGKILQAYNLHNIITTIIVLKPSDTIELSRYHLCQVINKKVLLKVVDKFRCLLVGTLRIDIEY